MYLLTWSGEDTRAGPRRADGGRGGGQECRTRCLDTRSAQRTRCSLLTVAGGRGVVPAARVVAQQLRLAEHAVSLLAGEPHHVPELARHAHHEGVLRRLYGGAPHACTARCRAGRGGAGYSRWQCGGCWLHRPSSPQVTRAAPWSWKPGWQENTARLATRCSPGEPSPP